MANDIVTRLKVEAGLFVSGAAAAGRAMTSLTKTVVVGARTITSSLAPIGARMASSMLSSINSARQASMNAFASFGSGMKRLATTSIVSSRAIVGALAPISALFAGIFAVRASIGGAREAIQNERKLTAVLNATGMAAQLTTKQIQEYAEQRMALTNFDDDTTLGAASVLATFQNISGSMFTETLTAAQDLSTVLGTDLSSAAKTLGLALNDPATGLARLTRMGVTFTTEQQAQIQAMQEAGDVAGAQAIILEELKNKMGGAAEAVVDPWTRVTNTLGEVAENIGHVVMPSINLLSDSLNEMMGGTAGSTAMFKEMGTIAASVFGNLGTVGQLAWTQIKLGIVSAGAEVMHFFTGTLPTVFNWFLDNWEDIWTTALNFVKTVLSNMGENIVELFKNIPGLIAGTVDLEEIWTPLMEGMENTIRELPDMPERVMGDLERQLTAERDALTTQLSEAISTDLIAAQAREDATAFAQGMMMDMQDAELPDTAPDSQGRAESSAGALDARTREAVAAVARATNDARNPMQRIAERQLTVLQSVDEGVEDLTTAVRAMPRLGVAHI